MKTCWLCGYSSWAKVGWTKYNGHRVHVGCLCLHVSKMREKTKVKND